MAQTYLGLHRRAKFYGSKSLFTRRIKTVPILPDVIVLSLPTLSLSHIAKEKVPKINWI